VESFAASSPQSLPLCTANSSRPSAGKNFPRLSAQRRGRSRSEATSLRRSFRRDPSKDKCRRVGHRIALRRLDAGSLFDATADGSARVGDVSRFRPSILPDCAARAAGETAWASIPNSGRRCDGIELPRQFSKRHRPRIALASMFRTGSSCAFPFRQRRHRFIRFWPDWAATGPSQGTPLDTAADRPARSPRRYAPRSTGGTSGKLAMSTS